VLAGITGLSAAADSSNAVIFFINFIFPLLLSCSTVFTFPSVGAVFHRPDINATIQI
jgi:hypothetical protein